MSLGCKIGLHDYEMRFRPRDKYDPPKRYQKRIAYYACPRCGKTRPSLTAAKRVS